MTFREYNPETDEKAALRIWYECGWLKKEEKKETQEALQAFLADGTADVAVENDEAECMVTTHPGTILMLDRELPFCAVTSVTVSRVLRKRGAAGRLLAKALERAAEGGSAVAGLGIFDQGFYDRLGFGCFPYLHHIDFDPAALTVPYPKRAPIRLDGSDIPRMAANIQERRPYHGLVRFSMESFFKLESLEAEDDGFGLGFQDDQGRLTHHFWGKAKGEHGPYSIDWMAFRTFEEMVELFSVMKSLSDQVYGMNIVEPAGIQFQDFLSRPFRRQHIAKGGDFHNEPRAFAWRQVRILDLPATLKPLKVGFGGVSFNVSITDPVESFLGEDSSWRGIGGDWTVILSENGSTAQKGHTRGLPVMKVTTNAVSRLFFGAASASALEATGGLSAPTELIGELDRKLRLPPPNTVQAF